MSVRGLPAELCTCGCRRRPFRSGHVCALQVKAHPDETTVSIVPGMSRQELDRLTIIDRANRLERLEREVADLRARPATTIVVTPVVDEGSRYAVVPSARRPYDGRPHPDYGTR